MKFETPSGKDDWLIRSPVLNQTKILKAMQEKESCLDYRLAVDVSTNDEHDGEDKDGIALAVLKALMLLMF